jgi:hypothetical protein
MPYFLNFRKRPNGGEVADSLAEVGVFFVQPGSELADPTMHPNPASLASAMLGKHVIFATHGFNVDQARGYAQLSNWSTLLQLDESFLFVGMVWPGDSSWLGPLCYPGEGQHAIHCGDLLAQFIATYAGGAASISFVSHSLGARFILQAIDSLPNNTSVRQIAILAGAINDDCLTAEYSKAIAKVTKINLLVSKEDQVLQWAFPIGNVAEGIIDKDHPYWHGALGRDGPQVQVTGKSTGQFLIPDRWAFGHHNYIELGPALVPPFSVVDVPPQGADLPYKSPPLPEAEWQPSWAAAFVSTRFK